MHINIKDFNLEQTVKLCLAVNTVLLSFVLFMTAFFWYYHIIPMLFYSFAAIIAYIFYYLLLKKQQVCGYMWCVYATIVMYMAVATICLGYEYGFNLYCMSIIPIIFYSRYISTKLQTADTHPVLVSVIIVAISVISSAIAIANGPLYVINRTAASVILACNSISVAAFLIYYTNMIVNMVIESEKKLNSIANVDLLTNLYSRRYMINYLENDISGCHGWLAMADVDNFKSINDTYGHNCGDYVLTYIADKMKHVCPECVVSRWGGEEFLIYSASSHSDTRILEELRKEIAESACIYNNQKINISVTIGVARRSSSDTMEEWVKQADDKLYYGKNNGKNVVID